MAHAPQGVDLAGAGAIGAGDVVEHDGGRAGRPGRVDGVRDGGGHGFQQTPRTRRAHGRRRHGEVARALPHRGVVSA